jgi:hypothetical protein
MRLAFTLAFLALIQQSGCDFADKKNVPTKAAVQHPPLHRFVLTRFPTDNGVAFDTETGEICRTWDWQPGGKALTPDPVTGTLPQRAVGEFAPTCLSLFEKYPSVPDGGVQPIEDQQPDAK